MELDGVIAVQLVGVRRDGRGAGDLGIIARAVADGDGAGVVIVNVDGARRNGGDLVPCNSRIGRAANGHTIDHGGVDAGVARGEGRAAHAALELVGSLVIGHVEVAVGAGGLAKLLGAVSNLHGCVEVDDIGLVLAAGDDQRRGSDLNHGTIHAVSVKASAKEVVVLGILDVLVGVQRAGGLLRGQAGDRHNHLFADAVHDKVLRIVEAGDLNDTLCKVRTIHRQLSGQLTVHIAAHIDNLCGRRGIGGVKVVQIHLVLKNSGAVDLDRGAGLLIVHRDRREEGRDEGILVGGHAVVLVDKLSVLSHMRINVTDAIGGTNIVVCRNIVACQPCRSDEILRVRIVGRDDRHVIKDRVVRLFGIISIARTPLTAQAEIGAVGIMGLHPAAKITPKLRVNILDLHVLTAVILRPIISRIIGQRVGVRFTEDADGEDSGVLIALDGTRLRDHFVGLEVLVAHIEVAGLTVGEEDDNGVAIHKIVLVHTAANLILLGQVMSINPCALIRFAIGEDLVGHVQAVLGLRAAVGGDGIDCSLNLGVHGADRAVRGADQRFAVVLGDAAVTGVLLPAVRAAGADIALGVGQQLGVVVVIGVVR